MPTRSVASVSSVSVRTTTKPAVSQQPVKFRHAVHTSDAFEPANERLKASATKRAPSIATLAKPTVDLRRPTRSVFAETDCADPAIRPNHQKGGATYSDTRSQELYGAAGPRLDDVRQGGTGDCWFMSSLGSLVNADPQRVRDMLRDNGDGTYSVRFYAATPKGSGNFSEEWETVDDDLARWKNSTDEVYAKANDSDGDGRKEIWVAMIEKALVQHFEKHFPEQGSGFGALDDDLMSRGMEALTGHRATTVMTGDTSADAMWQQLNRVNQGELVSAATPRDGKLMPGLWQPHCYTVTAVVEVNGQRFVDLRNPAGRGEPFDYGGPSDGVFRLTYADFRANFSEVAAAA